MLATPSADYQSPKHHREKCSASAKMYQTPYIIDGLLVFVDNVKAHYRRANDHGATILSEIKTGGPGTNYSAEDPEGHRWMFLEKKNVYNKS